MPRPYATRRPYPRHPGPCAGPRALAGHRHRRRQWWLALALHCAPALGTLALRLALLAALAALALAAPALAAVPAGYTPPPPAPLAPIVPPMAPLWLALAPVACWLVGGVLALATLCGVWR